MMLVDVDVDYHNDTPQGAKVWSILLMVRSKSGINSPVEGTVVYLPWIVGVSYTIQTVVGNGISEPSTVLVLQYKVYTSPWEWEGKSHPPIILSKSRKTAFESLQRTWPYLKHSKKRLFDPIGSMGLIVSDIYHEFMVDVGKYTIHGSYGDYSSTHTHRSETWVPPMVVGTSLSSRIWDVIKSLVILFFQGVVLLRE